MASTQGLTFHDKIVVVTGGNSGVGAATVAEFIAGGAKVAILDIRPPAEPITSDQRLDITCNIGIEEEAEAAIAKILQTWGSIDVLCNVAGIQDPIDRVSETDTATWDRVFKTNVYGPFYLIRACVNHFLSKATTDPPSTRGSIVNVCSPASTRGSFAGTAYTSSKHALLGLSRSTAWMYAKEGIRCNAIMPGGMMTNIVGNSGYSIEEVMSRPGMKAVAGVHQLSPGLIDPKQVAKAILFCAGSESINGAELAIDAGWATI